MLLSGAIDLAYVQAAGVFPRAAPVRLAEFDVLQMQAFPAASEDDRVWQESSTFHDKASEDCGCAFW